MEKVGVIGLGNIGGSIVKRLISLNYLVVVYDIDSKKREEYRKEKVNVANSITEILENNINYLITSLPNDDAVMNVLNDNKDVFKTFNLNITLIELSTILPQTIKKLQRNFTELNIKIIDCPISGGPIEAKQGNLNLIVSGEEQVYVQSKKILKTIGTNINYVGKEIGEAKAIKLINNIMTMGNVLVASEAFSLGLRFGIKPDTLYSILSQTGGTSHHFKKRFPKVLNNDYSPLFSIRLGEKDLNLAKEWANSNGFESYVTNFISEQYSKASEKKLGNEDIVSIIKCFLN